MPRPSRQGVWGRPHCQVYHRPGPGRWDHRPSRPARPPAASPPNIQYLLCQRPWLGRWGCRPPRPARPPAASPPDVQCRTVFICVPKTRAAGYDTQSSRQTHPKHTHNWFLTYWRKPVKGVRRAQCMG